MKKVITILFIIMLFITIIQIRDTYALYKSQLTGEFQTLLGVWSVKINETDLTSGNADMTFEITEDYLHFEDSDFVAPKVIAPGSEAYFDILIDATNTDVSVRYDIQIADSAKIKIGEDTLELPISMSIEILDVEDTFIKGEETDTITEHINNVDIENKTVSGVLPLSVSEAGYQGKVRVKFKWKNDDNNNLIDTMLGNDGIGNNLGYTIGNNDIDIALTNSTEQPSIVIPVKLVVSQYIGEELTIPVLTQ